MSQGASRCIDGSSQICSTLCSNAVISCASAGGPELRDVGHHILAPCTPAGLRLTDHLGTMTMREEVEPMRSLMALPILLFVVALATSAEPADQERAVTPERKALDKLVESIGSGDARTAQQVYEQIAKD